MANFLSHDVYFSIFKRHIERKLMEINMNCEPITKKVISFDQSHFRKSISTTDNKLISFNVIEELRNENDKCRSNEVNMSSENIYLSGRNALLNESPPMDCLDESFMSSSSEGNSQNDECRQEMFIDWFLSIVLVRNEEESIERASELLISSRISVIINEDHLSLSDIANKKQVEIAWKQSWILLYLLCKSQTTISIYAFSGKLVVKLIIDACVADLGFVGADLYRVLAFLTDHPIIDLQLACSSAALLDPDKSGLSSCWESLQSAMRNIPSCSSSGKIDPNLMIHNNQSRVSRVSESDQLSDLHDYLMDKLRSDNTIDIFLSISCSTNVSLAALEYFGIDIDMDQWEQFHRSVTSALETVEREISSIAGSAALCLSSPAHLREIIYNKLRLHDCLTEEQWNEIGMGKLIKSQSTNESVLSRMAEFHSLPNLLIKYRQISKTKSIYVDSFTLLIDRSSRNNVIRGTWDQNSCVTGRIYCSRPNLQALPRNELSLSSLHNNTEDSSLSLNVKSIFAQSSDHVIVSADYAHIELRLYAHLANDDRLISLFHGADAPSSGDSDLFTNMSGCLLGLQSSSLPSNNDARQTTKQVIYACLYGIGGKGLAETLGISVSQATAMIKLVKDYLPKLEVFSNNCFKQVEQCNFSTTITGRKRYFEIQPNSDFIQKMQLKRQIMSYIIQGSAADICKVTMINCQREIGYKNIDARLILSRHDELVWRVNKIYLIELIDIIYKTMNTNVLRYKLASHTESINLRVPLKVKVKKGPSLISMEIIEHLTK